MEQEGMSMAKTLKEVIGSLPAKQQDRVRARGRELIAEELTLQQLRKALGRTQTLLARQIGKPQATISRMEQQSDMLLSTLDHVIAALGGRLRLVVELPNRRPVSLAGFGDIGRRAASPRRTLRQAAAVTRL
jgi:hypothetical protein